MDEYRVKIKNNEVINKYIVKGKTIILLMKISGETKAQRSLITEIDDNEIFITFPFQDYSHLIQTKMAVKVRVFPDDGYYVEFDSQIIKLHEELGKMVLSVGFPQILIKVQRRDSYRVPVNIKGNLFSNEKGVLPKEVLKDTLDDLSGVVLLNLSLGGSLVASNKHYNQTDRCILKFKVPTFSKVLTLSGIIVRSKKVEGLKSKYLFHFGFKFDQIKEVLINQSLSKYLTQIQLIQASGKKY